MQIVVTHWWPTSGTPIREITWEIYITPWLVGSDNVLPLIFEKYNFSKKLTLLRFVFFDPMASRGGVEVGTRG